MVWIHGGTYQTGCTAEKEFDGSALARRGVVVVSVGYRLNVFGFLAHNRLREEAEARHDDEPYANFGFLDQRAGIRWVVKNIAAFGGDPENITIFGQSAGAGSVLAQICSPLNRGLFQRAIMQSGAGLGMFNRHQQSLEDGHRTAERLFEALGVSSLDEARQVPAAELLAAAEALPVPPESGREGDWSMMVNWVPCVDGRFITDQYARTIARGEQNEADRPFWAQAAKASREYLVTACHPQTGMNPEYSNYDGTPHVDERDHWHFYSDAYRTAGNIGLDCLWNGVVPDLCDANARLQRFFLEHDRTCVYAIDGTPVDETVLHPVGFIAATAEGSLAAMHSQEPDALDNAIRWVRLLWDTPIRTGTRRYYDNFLYAFAFLALAGEYRVW